MCIEFQMLRKALENKQIGSFLQYHRRLYQEKDIQLLEESERITQLLNEPLVTVLFTNQNFNMKKPLTERAEAIGMLTHLWQKVSFAVVTFHLHDENLQRITNKVFIHNILKIQNTNIRWRRPWRI